MDKNLKNKVVETIIDKWSVKTYSPFSYLFAEELIKKIEIKEPLEKLQNNISCREWSLFSADEELNLKLNDRFMNLNMTEITEYFIKTMCYGFGVFEKIYNENFELVKLVPVPHRFLAYNSALNCYELNIDSKLKLNDQLKYLEIKYKGDISNRGESILEILYKTLKNLENIEEKLQGIVEKYGDTLVIFGYQEGEANEEIKKKGELLKEMTAKKNVLGVEINDETKVGDWYQLVTLNDLKTDIHQALEDRYIKKINKYILGADFTDSGSATGSQARDQVQLEIMEKKEESVIKWIRDSLQSLITQDSIYFSYIAKDVYFKFSKELNEKDEIEKDKLKQEKNKTFAEFINTLSNTGVSVSLDYISNKTGIPLKDLGNIEVSKEFEEDEVQKKKELNNEKNLAFDKFTEIAEAKFLKEISIQVKEVIENAKSEEVLKQLSFDTGVLEEDFIISTMVGATDEYEVSNLISANKMPNPFNKDFEQTISYLNNRTPELYETFDEITNEVRANFSWVKRSTDLEVTKKLMNNLNRAVENAESFESWKANSNKVLKETGLDKDGWYLRNVYRTNTSTAYSLGRAKQQDKTKGLFPYRLYDAVNDGRTSEICKQLDGKVYKSTSSIWNRIYPPNHFQCRSTVIGLTEEQYKGSSYKISDKPNKNLLDSLDTFDGNVADYWGKIKRNVKKKEKQLKIGG